MLYLSESQKEWECLRGHREAHKEACHKMPYSINSNPQNTEVTKRTLSKNMGILTPLITCCHEDLG